MDSSHTRFPAGLIEGGIVISGGHPLWSGSYPMTFVTFLNPPFNGINKKPWDLSCTPARARARVCEGGSGSCGPLLQRAATSVTEVQGQLGGGSG